MFPYSQSVTPAVRTHLDAQMSFFNDMSKSLFQSFQQVVNLNLQLTQTMMEESSLTGQQLLSAEGQIDVIKATASRAQPTAEKLRAYQQHLSRVAADAQVELARVTEEHVPETARTARALADEVSRVATEANEQSRKSQQEAVNKFADPFAQQGVQRGNDSSARAGASLQSASGGSAQGASAGSPSELSGNMQSDNHGSRSPVGSTAVAGTAAKGGSGKSS